MYLPLWLIVLMLAALLVLAGLALRGRGGREMVEQQRRSAPAPTAEHLAVLADAEVRTAIASGNKIQAIKLIRERTGLGLKEAKDLVEREPAS